MVIIFVGDVMSNASETVVKPRYRWQQESFMNSTKKFFIFLVLIMPVLKKGHCKIIHYGKNETDDWWGITGRIKAVLDDSENRPNHFSQVNTKIKDHSWLKNLTWWHIVSYYFFIVHPVLEVLSEVHKNRNCNKSTADPKATKPNYSDINVPDLKIAYCGKRFVGEIINAPML
jgi:hypothetical protein